MPSNVREYERLKETLDVLSDPDLMKQIRESEAYFAAGGKGLGYEEVFGEPEQVYFQSAAWSLCYNPHSWWSRDGWSWVY